MSSRTLPVHHNLLPTVLPLHELLAMTPPTRPHRYLTLTAIQPSLTESELCAGCVDPSPGEIFWLPALPPFQPPFQNFYCGV
eukprot:3601512-Rhodomonas_salina.2